MSNQTKLQELRNRLHTQGCTKCSLGFQEGLNGCCVARGDSSKRRMIVGEAPGKYEDANSEPFVGPAGQLMDKIFSSVGLDTNKDFYVTNIVLCRPIAAKGSGKENYTPRIEQREKCEPYLIEQLDYINPKLIVTMGKPATEAILRVKGIRMGDYRGKIKTIYREYGAIYVFPMLHPAAILHATRQPDKEQLYKEQTWKDIQYLKEFMKEKGI